jgi:hypothetical protein
MISVNFCHLQAVTLDGCTQRNSFSSPSSLTSLRLRKGLTINALFNITGFIVSSSSRVRGVGDRIALQSHDESAVNYIDWGFHKVRCTCAKYSV